MSEVVDFYYDGEMIKWLMSECFDMLYMYGIGCIFLVCIVVEFVKGNLFLDSVMVVKEFIISVIKYLFGIGYGYGLINYFVYWLEDGKWELN